MIHLVYHAHCADGFASAVIAHHALSLDLATAAEEIRLHPISYDDIVQEPPLGTKESHAVYYLDYTPPWEVIQFLRLCPVLRSLTIIDHHASRAAVHADLATTPSPVKTTSVFDTAHSGAALTYQHFFPNSEIPEMVQLIEWRDLGHAFQMPDHVWSPLAHAVHATLMRATPRTVEAWKLILAGDSKTVSEHDAWLSTGARLLQKDARIIAQATSTPYWLILDGQRIPAVNGLSHDLNSQACAALLTRYPEAAFSAYWHISPSTGHITYGLRSRRQSDTTGAGHVNVAEIAQRLSPDGRGGGHPCAAGFTTPEPMKFA